MKFDFTAWPIVKAQGHGVLKVIRSMEHPSPNPLNAGRPSKTSARGKVSRWALFLPFIGLAALAAVWVFIWNQARDVARAGLEEWRAEEAAEGRTYACASEGFAGFPFRMEWICEDFTALVRDGSEEAELRLARVVAVAQAYNLGHVIVEFDAPGIVTVSGVPDALRSTWSLGHASLRFDGRAIDRMSLHFEALSTALTSGGSAPPSGRDPLFSVEDVIVHSRRAPDAPPGGRDYDVTGKVDGLRFDEGDEPLSGGFDMALFALPRNGANLAAFLRDWQTRNGRLDLSRMEIRGGREALSATGDFALTSSGHLQGNMALGVSMTDGQPAGALTRVPTLATLAAMIALFGKDGEAADGIRVRTVDIAFDAGKVGVGPVTLGVIPPLFRP